MIDLRKQAAVVGTGTTQFARAIPNKTGMGLRLEAAMKAIADAGLKKDDIDGIITSEGGGIGNPRTHIEFSEHLGIFGKPLCTSVPMGGASATFAVDIARWSLATGRCKYVLIADSAKESDAGRSALGHSMTENLAHSPLHYPDYEHPFGPLIISFYGATAHRHMYEFGTKPEHLAGVAVAFRHNASLNPDATYRTPITIEDVLNSRMITSPLHLLDCCIINDGGTAFVMTTAERARDLPKPPIYILGSGGGHSGYFMGFLAQGDRAKGFDLVRTTARMAADEAFAQAGVERKDIDLVTMCDNFTITPIIQLEDYGFCAKGEGGPFVGDGSRLKVGGALPCNTHGGMMSCSHATVNYLNLTEAVRQLQGVCGDRQVKGAKIALHGSSAAVVSTHSVVVLARD